LNHLHIIVAALGVATEYIYVLLKLKNKQRMPMRQKSEAVAEKNRFGMFDVSNITDLKGLTMAQL
jgi:hypothetical protein